MKKVYVDLKVRLILLVGYTESVEDVINDMDYNFTTNDPCVIQDSEILDYKIVDVK